MPELTREPNQLKYHFFLVADGGGPPVSLASDDLEQLKLQAYQEIMRAGTGWCHFIIDSQRCHISSPSQSFQLRMPDGLLAELRDPGAPVFDPNGKFSVLRPRQDDFTNLFLT